MGAMAQPPCPRGLVESSTWKVERNIKKLPPSFFDLSRSWVVSRLQNLSHYPALSAAGRRMPDARRQTLAFKTWKPWSPCSLCKAHYPIIPWMMALTIPQNTLQKRYCN